MSDTVKLARATTTGLGIAESILDLIGDTPMVRLKRMSEELALTSLLAMKLEAANPGGSAKDRPALEMVLQAEADGLLQPGGTIVEPTSGNTGVGLAIVAAQRGYRCVFVVTDKVAPEKVDLLRAYGADVVVCPVAVPPDHPDSYYCTAERLVAEIPGAYRPNQYANSANPRAHTLTTGPEIWRQTDGRVTHFVAGAGTCGTLTGTARYLKAQNPEIRIIAADPQGSIYSGGSGRPYLVEGVGEDFFPTAWDPTLIDEIIEVSDRDSFLMARHVSRTEGILTGGSGGMAVAAALQVARRCGPDDVIVVLNPDSGRGYLSRVFNDTWMATHGFLGESDGPTVAEVLPHRADRPPLLYVNPAHTVRDAIAVMQREAVSQLPVCKNEPPFAIAEVAGAVHELELMAAAQQDRAVLDRPVAELMGRSLPTIGVGQPAAHAARLLQQDPALLVLADGRPSTVVTRADMLTYFSHTPRG